MNQSVNDIVRRIMWRGGWRVGWGRARVMNTNSSIESRTREQVCRFSWRSDAFHVCILDSQHDFEHVCRCGAKHIAGKQEDFPLDLGGRA